MARDVDDKVDALREDLTTKCTNEVLKRLYELVMPRLVPVRSAGHVRAIRDAVSVRSAEQKGETCSNRICNDVPAGNANQDVEVSLESKGDSIVGSCLTAWGVITKPSEDNADESTAASQNRSSTLDGKSGDEARVDLTSAMANRLKTPLPSDAKRNELKRMVCKWIIFETCVLIVVAPGSEDEELIRSPSPPPPPASLLSFAGILL